MVFGLTKYMLHRSVPRKSFVSGLLCLVYSPRTCVLAFKKVKETYRLIIIDVHGCISYVTDMHDILNQVLLMPLKFTDFSALVPNP